MLEFLPRQQPCGTVPIGKEYTSLIQIYGYRKWQSHDWLMQLRKSSESLRRYKSFFMVQFQISNRKPRRSSSVAPIIRLSEKKSIKHGSVFMAPTLILSIRERKLPPGFPHIWNDIQSLSSHKGALPRKSSGDSHSSDSTHPVCYSMPLLGFFDLSFLYSPSKASRPSLYRFISLW